MADKYPGWGAYVYCLNNPLEYWDPTGESWIDNTSGEIAEVMIEMLGFIQDEYEDEIERLEKKLEKGKGDSEELTASKEELDLMLSDVTKSIEELKEMGDSNNKQAFGFNADFTGKASGNTTKNDQGVIMMEYRDGASFGLKIHEVTHGAQMYRGEITNDTRNVSHETEAYQRQYSADRGLNEKTGRIGNGSHMLDAPQRYNDINDSYAKKQSLKAGSTISISEIRLKLK